MGIFTKKDLKFVITLGASAFDDKGHNQLVIQGLRASVDITNPGNMQMSELNGRIYGLSMSDMNAITCVNFTAYAKNRNHIAISAIEGDSETVVYAGNIYLARGNFQGAPDVFLDVRAQSGLDQQLATADPLSYSGLVDVAAVMRQLAEKMGYAFENNGVITRCADAYLCDTLLNQVKQLAEQAGIDPYVLAGERTLAICPKGQPRGTVIPEISPSSGLIGYPIFDNFGVTFQTLYNPAIHHGGAVKLVTDIKQADGTWWVSSIKHQLESETPDGKWESTIVATPINQVAMSR